MPIIGGQFYDDRNNVDSANANLRAAAAQQVLPNNTEGLISITVTLCQVNSAQAYAQLEIAAQLKRIADAIEEHTA